jgi:hypothetical protein
LIPFNPTMFKATGPLPIPPYSNLAKLSVFKDTGPGTLYKYIRKCTPTEFASEWTTEHERAVRSVSDELQKLVRLVAYAREERRDAIRILETLKILSTDTRS